MREMNYIEVSERVCDKLNPIVTKVVMNLGDEPFWLRDNMTRSKYNEIAENVMFSLKVILEDVGCLEDGCRGTTIGSHINRRLSMEHDDMIAHGIYYIGKNQSQLATASFNKAVILAMLMTDVQILCGTLDEIKYEERLKELSE